MIKCSKQYRDQRHSTIFLVASQLLLSIICLVHALAMACYTLQVPLQVYVFPLALSIAIGGYSIFYPCKMIVLKALGLSLLALSIALSISYFYFDLSWDGQWYQQEAVYDLAGKWNPLFKPLMSPDESNHTSILHFPKGTWYFGAALLRFFGNVEVGKAYNLIVIFAASGVIYAFCRDLGISVRKSILLMILVIINPVVWSEITTYLNDGDLYLLLVTYLLASILWLRNNAKSYLAVASLAVCCLVNTKFTGLVFFLITASFIFIYVLLRQRSFILRFVFTHIVIGVFAIVVFGFNPYVTNFIYRGHPLYPLMGTKAFPSVFANGNDDNEAYETPQNIKGKSLPVRLFYANFGEPGNAPYNGEDGSKLVNPLNLHFKTWSAYHYHETRVSGFGPYFGILLLIASIGFPILLFREKASSLAIVLCLGGMVYSLSLSKHFWWPRFFPMLWLLPSLPLLLSWIGNRPSKLQNCYGWLLILLFNLNGLIVAVFHMKWETASSIALRRELELIQTKKRPITIDYGWFKRSVEEKLKYHNIHFTSGSLPGPDSLKYPLPSVVEGYPNQVTYQIK